MKRSFFLKHVAGVNLNNEQRRDRHWRRYVALCDVDDAADKIFEALTEIDAVPGFYAKPPRRCFHWALGRLISDWQKGKVRDLKVGKEIIKQARKFLSARLQDLDHAKEAVEDALTD